MMSRFLIDVNLPYKFSIWLGDEFSHMRDIGEDWTDSQIWQYARGHDMVIVSKDADFSDRAMITAPPPRVVHIRLGNMRMRDFHGLLSQLWPTIATLSQYNRLVRVYQNRIECIE